MSKVILEPTFKGFSARTYTPAALTLAVVPRCLRGDCSSEMVIGNCSGKRGRQRDGPIWPPSSFRREIQF
jgi:hypothetical protein